MQMCVQFEMISLLCIMNSVVKMRLESKRSFFYDHLGSGIHCFYISETFGIGIGKPESLRYPKDARDTWRSDVKGPLKGFF